MHTCISFSLSLWGTGVCVEEATSTVNTTSLLDSGHDYTLDLEATFPTKARGRLKMSR